MSACKSTSNERDSCDVRRIDTEKDVFIRKETYSYEKRRIHTIQWARARVDQMRRIYATWDELTRKKTNSYGQRRIHTKRDVLIHCVSEKKAVQVGLDVRVHIQVRREIVILPVHKQKTFSYDSVSECKRTSNETYSYVNSYVTRRLYTQKDVFIPLSKSVQVKIEYDVF